MAEFNPKTPEVNPPNFTGLSHRGEGNQAFESLFKGIGDVLGKVVQTADTYVQSDIENKARYAFDSLNDETGLSASQVPQEITQSQAGLQRLASAQAQGRVTPEYYYQRLASTMKGLRARYPGYEKEVDQIVQKVTGQNPANVFRNMLLQNINEANAKAASAADKTDTFIRSNAQYLNPDEIASYMQDGGSKYGGSQGVMTKILTRKSVEAQEAAERVKAQQDQSKAEQYFNTRSNQQANSAIEQLGGAIGIGSQSFGEFIANAGKVGLPEEQLNTVKANLDAYIIKQRQEMVHRGSLNGFSNIPTATKNTIIEAALQPLKDMRAALESKNYSQAAQIAARVQAMSDESVLELYQKIPALKTVKAISSISPQTADGLMMNYIQQRYGSLTNMVDKQPVLDSLRATLNGETSASEIAGAVRDSSMTAQKKQKILGDYVAGFRSSAQVAQTPEQVEAFVQKNYSFTADGDQLWQVVPNNQKLSLFNQMFSPEMTKKIKESGSENAMTMYQNAAVNRFQSVPEFRSIAGSVNDWLPYLQHVRAEYNPTTNRLELSVNKEALGKEGFFTRNDQQMGLVELNHFVDKFNQGLLTMAPIIEAAGGDETQGVKRLLRSMSLDIDGGKENGLFNVINKALDRLVGSGESNKETQSLGSEVIPAVPELTGFNLEKIRQDSGGDLSSVSTRPVLNLIARSEGTTRGYDTQWSYGKYSPASDKKLTDMTLNEVLDLQAKVKANPENPLIRGQRHAPMGRYQIVPGTLRSLINEMGLKGTEKFTPELQDRMAGYLLERRGFNQWRAGQMSDAQFLKNLSQEWSSLPGGIEPSGKVRASELTDTLRRDTTPPNKRERFAENSAG